MQMHMVFEAQKSRVEKSSKNHMHWHTEVLKLKNPKLKKA
jgi:hypothetical protein